MGKLLGYRYRKDPNGKKFGGYIQSKPLELFCGEWTTSAQTLCV
jgi:hypothetical protein